MQVVDPSSSVQGPGQEGAGHHTALHKAASVGNSDVVAALIQGGCALDLQNRVSCTSISQSIFVYIALFIQSAVTYNAKYCTLKKTTLTLLHGYGMIA